MMPYSEVAYRMFTLSLGDNLSELIKLADTVGVLANSHVSFAQSEGNAKNCGTLLTLSLCGIFRLSSISFLCS